MPTMTTPQEIAAAIESALDGGGHLVIRFGHAQMRQLKDEEVALLVATLKTPRPEAALLLDACKQAEAYFAHREGKMGRKFVLREVLQKAIASHGPQERE